MSNSSICLLLVYWISVGNYESECSISTIIKNSLEFRCSIYAKTQKLAEPLKKNGPKPCKIRVKKAI